MNKIVNEEVLKQQKVAWEKRAFEEGLNPEDVYFFIMKHARMHSTYVEAYLNARYEGRETLQEIQRKTRLQNSFILVMMEAENAFNLQLVRS